MDEGVGCKVIFEGWALRLLFTRDEGIECGAGYRERRTYSHLLGMMDSQSRGIIHEECLFRDVNVKG